MTFDPERKEPVKIVNDNQQTQRVQNRADDTTNDAAPIKVTLYTVDNAIIKYLSDRIKPVVTQNGNQVNVPIIYGNPERWKSAQRDGVLRDSIGKVQLPMLLIRRTAMKKTGINSPVNKYYDRTFYTGWNRRTPYDRFNLVEFWGEQNSYKFRTIIDSFEPLTELPSSNDRVVRTQFDMTVYAYLLPESQLDVGHNRGVLTRKKYGVKKVVTFTEIED